MSETGTENPTVNPENGDNGNGGENPPETPAFEMPTVENLDLGDVLATGLGQNLLKQLQNVLTIDALLERQKSDFNEDKLIELAANSDNPEIKSAYATYAKQVERLKQLTANLLTKVTENIGDEKLSQEEIDAKKETRKSVVDTVKSSITVLESLIDQGVPGERTEYAKEFIANIKIPGARSSSGTSTAPGSGTPKPRLNGGTISIGNQNINAFPAAAKALSDKIGREVSTPELINAWVDSQNVGDWKDIPQNSSFKFGDVEITIVKLPKKPKTEKAEESAAA